MSQAKARIQYRGKEVTVLGGHRAVLDCYKKKMLGQVIVDVEEIEGDNGVVPGSVINIDSNGEKNVAGYETAKVDVKMSFQEKIVTPSESQQVITPDESKDGLSKVTVNAIEAETVNITGNGTVFPTEGKYIKQVNVSVPSQQTTSGTLNITENDTYDVRGVASAVVNVQPKLESVTVTPDDYDQIITASEGNDGLSEVTVKRIPLETKTITENGTHSATPGKFFETVVVDVLIPDAPTGSWHITQNGSYNVSKYAEAVVDVQPPLQDKIVKPSTEEKIVTADGTNYGLSQVKIEAIQTQTANITEPMGEVTPDDGKFFDKVIVNIPTVTVHSGTSEPTNDIGADGDIYLLLEG